MLLAEVFNEGEEKICEITNMFDLSGEEVSDPKETSAAVIKWNEDTWIVYHSPLGTSIHDIVLREH